MNFHLSFTMGNNHEQAPKQQIDETEKICCDLENTLTIENYKIQQQERLRALEVSSRAQSNFILRHWSNMVSAKRRKYNIFYYTFSNIPDFVVRSCSLCDVLIPCWRKTS